jgi:5-methylcytosine-specific restriction endonuclease McrA
MGLSHAKPLPELSASEIAEFWEHVDVRGPEECWPWKGFCNSYGVGCFCLSQESHNGRKLATHRVALFLHSGVDPVGLYVRHIGLPDGETHKKCCNAAHLFPASIRNAEILLPGTRFGEWTVLSHAGFRKSRAFFMCRCSCGTEKVVKAYNLRKGISKNCGCVNLSERRIRPFESLYRMARASATKRGRREFALSYEEFVEFTNIHDCHYCGAPVVWMKYSPGKRRTSARYNLDRKDGAGGYVRENLVVCCKRCNWAKNNHFTYAEWLEIGQLIRTWATRDDYRAPFLPPGKLPRLFKKAAIPVTF